MSIIYILVALFLILIPFLFKSTTKIFYIKGFLLPFVCILFILCLIFFSDTTIESASKGLNLWLTIVFPSLFPFFVASELLNSSGFIKKVGIFLEPIMRPLFNVPGCGSFAFALGITSGYPVGAKITAGMRQEKLITKIEAERLLTFTNNSGPLFVVGAVSAGMFQLPHIGVFLLICHIAASISVGILFRYYGKKNDLDISYVKNVKKNIRKPLPITKQTKTNSRKTSLNFGIVFGEAIKNSIMTLLSIGGFIVLFSVIISLLLKLGIIDLISFMLLKFLAPLGVNREIIAALLSGIFEITTGSSMAANAVSAPIGQQLAAASMVMGWAGLSVHSQVLSIISNTDINIKPYLVGKLMQGVFAGIYTFIGLKIVGKDLFRTENASHILDTPIIKGWQDILFTSGLIILLIIILFLLLTAILMILKFIKTSLKQYKQI